MKNLSRLILAGILALPGMRLSAAAAGPAPASLLEPYVKVASALAADNLAAAKTAAKDLGEKATATGNKEIAGKAQAVSKATKIAAARDSFKALSAAVEPLALREKSYVVMYCPMADADWIQATGDTKNPYFGKSMLTCGEPKQSK